MRARRKRLLVQVEGIRRLLWMRADGLCFFLNDRCTIDLRCLLCLPGANGALIELQLSAIPITLPIPSFKRHIQTPKVEAATTSRPSATFP